MVLSRMNYKQLILVWESYHYRFGLAGEGQADAIQAVLEGDPGLVLNVGCGLNGQKVANLASHCDAQVALDKDAGMVRAAKSTCVAGNVTFLGADAHSLPFAASCAHHVIALGLFAYILDPVLVLGEFRRVTKPGGHVIITNSVSRSLETHKRAGSDAGLALVEEAEGYCPAASGDVKRRYMLIFLRN